MLKIKKTWKSHGGHTVYLNEAPVAMTSLMQRIFGLSTSETKLIEQCELAQDMLYVWRLLTEMELKVELPMISEWKNEKSFCFVNN